MKSKVVLSVAAAGLLLLSLPLSAQEKTLDELLGLDLTDLLNLKVVSALKGPETIDRTPATVRVITAETIRDNGYFTLEEALADLPGIQFRNIVGFNSYSFLRGVPAQNNKVLMLVDGILVNELNSGGFYGGMHYNLADVERIEVVYGPASALYGTNAVSGVINIVTRDAKGGTGGRVSAGLGNFGTRVADARYGYHAEKSKFGFNVAAMLKRSDKADLAGEAGDHNWTAALDTFENDAAVEARVRAGSFNAGVLFQDKESSFATTERSVGGERPAPVSDHGVNFHIRFVNAWASTVLERKASWSLRATAYYRNATVLDDSVPVIETASAVSAGRQFRWYRPNSLFGGEALFHWVPGPALDLDFGLVLEGERLAEAFSVAESASADVLPPVPPKPEMLANRLLSGYVQARISLFEGLKGFIGVRHDNSSYYGTVTTPRFGFVFNRARLTAKILYARAFRAPKPWDYTNGLGNPDLEPETIHSLEGAVAWSPSSFVRFDASVYRNRLSNLLTRVNQGDDWWWDNAGSLTTTGGEATFLYRRGRWNIWAGYTFTSSLGADGEQTPEIAPHGANLGAVYAFTPSLRLSLRGQYLGERKNTKIIPVTGTDRIDGAFVAHAVLSWRLPLGFDLQLAVNNLFDAVYYHPSNLPASRFRQPQRTFRLTAGFSF